MNSHVTGSEIFPDIINLKNQKPIIDIFVYFVILCFLVFILYYYFFFQDIQRVTGTWECECDGVKFNWEINKVSWYNNKEINITPDKEIIQGIVIKGSVFKYAIGKFKAGFSKKIGDYESEISIEGEINDSNPQRICGKIIEKNILLPFKCNR